MKDFKGKTAWITGASDGIGKELAKQLAEAGARIILTARSVEKLHAVKDQLVGEGHLVAPLDLLHSEEIPKTVDKVLSQVDAIDILVNNAGVSQRSLVKDTQPAVDRKIMELNHFAVVILTKAVLPHMMAQKSGLIIAVSSVAGKIGTPMRSAYCAAKHAVIGFMDSLRAEVHADNIRVMVVMPGSTQTNISANALEGDGQPHNVTDPLIANGIPVEECVRKIIRGIQKETPELLIAKGKEKMAVQARRFFPSLLFNMMTRLQAT
ncbi:MAG: SDR family oxidoreductase [Bacteroidota bacterium]